MLLELQVNPGLAGYGANEPVAFLQAIFICISHSVLSEKHFQGIPKDHTSLLKLSALTVFTSLTQSVLWCLLCRANEPSVGCYLQQCHSIICPSSAIKRHARVFSPVCLALSILQGFVGGSCWWMSKISACTRIETLQLDMTRLESSWGSLRARP